MIDKTKTKIKDSRFYYFTRSLVNHPLFSGSAIMIVGSNLVNFIAYIYHLVLGRLLGPGLYGDLAAMISLIGLVSTSFTFLGLVIVKFVSAAEEDERSGIFRWFDKKGWAMGAVLAFAALLATPFLSKFIHVDKATVVLMAPIFFFVVIGFIYRAFLQGLMKFKELVIVNNTDFLGRFVLGVAFVLLGFSVFGVVVGFTIAAAISTFLAMYFLTDLRKSPVKKVFKKGQAVVNYSIPILFISVAQNSMFTTDVVLVKHFFPGDAAGLYAAVSTLGKVIYFGSAPVASVMFPMISERHAKGGNYKKIFIYSLLLTAGIASGVLLIYWLLPEFSINLLYGSSYLVAAPYLVWMGVFMTVLTLASLLVNFFLSREKTKVAYFVVAAALMQVAGIWFFHDSLMTIIKVSIAATTFLLISLLIYFANESKTKEEKL